MDKVIRQEKIQQILVNENFKTFKELADEYLAYYALVENPI